MRLIKLIFLTITMTSLIVTAMLTYGQTYDGNGKIFGKKSQESMEPKTIIDTVRMKSGFGSLKLNNKFIQGQHNVAPTSSKTIYVTITQLLEDSTQFVHSYSWWFNNDRIGIKSDSSWDSSKVQITAIVK